MATRVPHTLESLSRLPGAVLDDVRDDEAQKRAVRRSQRTAAAPEKSSRTRAPARAIAS